MDIGYFAAATLRAVTASKAGPSLYDVCDPVLSNRTAATPTSRPFIKTALRNPALRPLLWRAGLPELPRRIPSGAAAEAIALARDHGNPDWARSARPVAELMDSSTRSIPGQSRVHGRSGRRARRPIDGIIRTCGRHLLSVVRPQRLHPGLCGLQPDRRSGLQGTRIVVALEGLNARGYKNSTLMFNLARVFIARSPSQAVINPPWTGVAEPMWSPVQIRHRSAYYDAFFVEALLASSKPGSRPQTKPLAHVERSPRWPSSASAPAAKVQTRDGSTFDVITALAPPPHPRFSRYFSRDQGEARLRHLCARLRHHGVLVLGRDASQR